MDILASSDASPEFLSVPRLVYKGAKDKLPYFEIGEEFLVSTAEQPFYRAADARFFTAMRNGRAEGRVAVVISHDHNSLWASSDAFLSFFECIEDYEVAQALFKAAHAWARNKSVRRMLATVNPSANYSTGVQVDGFESPPVLMLNPNPPYYPGFLLKAGYQGVMDWLAYLIRTEGMEEWLAPLRPLWRECVQQGVTFRRLRAADLEHWQEPVRGLYNDAFLEDWGFIPMGADEFNLLMRRLRPFWIDDLAIVAEYEGTPVGFVLTVDSPPTGGDFNPPHVLFLCVSRSNRNQFIGIGLAVEFVQSLIDSGRPAAEFHIQEAHVYMEKLAQSLGGIATKRYRLFERSLAD